MMMMKMKVKMMKVKMMMMMMIPYLCKIICRLTGGRLCVLFSL